MAAAGTTLPVGLPGLAKITREGVRRAASTWSRRTAKSSNSTAAMRRKSMPALWQAVG